MTEEERREAERLADKNYAPERATTNFSERQAFIRGYAAAVEAKRAEIADLKSKMNHPLYVATVDQIMKAERARSAKLIDDLREGLAATEWEQLDSIIEEAIAEYEAGK